MNRTVTNKNNYTYSPGDEVIIKTTLLNNNNNISHLLFPNHTIRCTVKYQCDCYLYLNDNIIFLETIISPISKLKNIIARDKLINVNPTIRDIYVKYKNNLYFNVTIHKINLELLNDIKKYIFVPSLYSSCFYALYTSELLKIRTYYMLH